jgi:hypothetical protein
MRVIDRLSRWLAAIAVTLAPLLALVLPSSVLPGAEYTNPEEQFTAYANSRFPFEGLWLQIAGAVFLIPAVQGVAAQVRGGRRGRAPALVSHLIGMVAAISLLLVLGIELGMAFIVSHSSDKEGAVALLVAMSKWDVYGVLLWIGLAGFFLALPALALALWRSGVVSIVVPILFLLPVLSPLLPLPGRAADLMPSFAMLLPCVWITVQLLRHQGPSPTNSAGTDLTAENRPLSDTSHRG